MIRHVIPECEAAIRLLPISSAQTRDKQVWLPIKNGKYSVRLGYGILSAEKVSMLQRDFNWQSNIWRLKTTPKIKHFLWKSPVRV